MIIGPTKGYGNCNGTQDTILYINSLRPSVCDGGFGGWGKGGEPLKQQSTCQQRETVIANGYNEAHAESINL